MPFSNVRQKTSPTGMDQQEHQVDEGDDPHDPSTGTAASPEPVARRGLEPPPSPVGDGVDGGSAATLPGRISGRRVARRRIGQPRRTAHRWISAEADQHEQRHDQQHRRHGGRAGRRCRSRSG